MMQAMFDRRYEFTIESNLEFDFLNSKLLSDLLGICEIGAYGALSKFLKNLL